LELLFEFVSFCDTCTEDVEDIDADELVEVTVDDEEEDNDVALVVEEEDTALLSKLT
tara:strand:+ start:1818 stop:1988 length:171 start_codon:yes stop_codon:yes gene_type:complete